MFTKDGIYTFIHGTRIGNAAAPPFLKFRSSHSFIIGTIATAVFTDIFLYSLVVPVLPFALTARAGVPEGEVQKWTSVFLSVYGAALAVASPTLGWLADRSTSRRMPLIVGLLALAAATAMLCIGTSLAVLIAGRILQGVSAAVVWTVGLALLSDTVEKEEIGQAMGYIAAATSIGSLAGPLLGGVVYARAGYYAVFAMGFALIGLDVFLRLMMIEKSVAAQWAVPDAAVAAAESRSEALPTSPVLEARSARGSGEVQSTGDMQEKAIVQTPSLRDDPAPKAFSQRLPPMIRLLRIPRLLASLLGCFVQSSSLAAFDSVLPLYVKDTFHWSSTGAGLIFICLVIPSLFGPVVGFLSDRYGPRPFTTLGLVGAIPFWVCLRFVDHESMAQKVLLCALLSLIGVCLTLSMTPLMAEIDHVLEEEERKNPGGFGEKGAAAQGFGLFNTSYALGSLIGPLWAGFIVAGSGWGTMVWTFAVLSGVVGIATFIWTGGRIVLKGGESSESEV
ncbi:MFS transporter-like protein [Coleophoma cylindrospora]|uniref:MFS transporter-like protein n=1 Tax=Coleophoma cylindrospora TaxID=1849047 RepID=A0A3D8S1A2_9HELO|nr:MFS transporter-like protein [Coleophoma cylindrospora]